MITDSHRPDYNANVAGSGRIELVLHGRHAVFLQLSYCYPLKLLSPHVNVPLVAIAYILTYGGGLVSGDRIGLQIEVGSGASLLLLTQGSTKVFKHRPGVRLSKTAESVENIFGRSTVQSLDVHVRQDGLLLLLPEPVTCFTAAAYNQIQTFHLEEDASVVLLDWITSGRMSRGEEWRFSRYYSINEVWLAKKRIARDVLLLDGDVSSTRSLKDRMGIYSCYATLIICGPKLRAVVEAIYAIYREISVYQQASPPDLIWSTSRIEDGCVVRVAANETEKVKSWIKEHLSGLADLVGAEVFGKALI
ncbi:hypothetical protein ACEPAG_801 [Sanghuangporus baumii]